MPSISGSIQIEPVLYRVSQHELLVCSVAEPVFLAADLPSQRRALPRTGQRPARFAISEGSHTCSDQLEYLISNYQFMTQCTQLVACRRDDRERRKVPVRKEARHGRYALAIVGHVRQRGEE
jgi:hypothetical protein